jgi:MFS family permease
MSANDASTVVRDRHERRFWLLLLAAVGATLVNPLIGVAASLTCASATPRWRWVFLALAALLIAWFLLLRSAGIEGTSELGTPVRKT